MDSVSLFFPLFLNHDFDKVVDPITTELQMVRIKEEIKKELNCLFVLCLFLIHFHFLSWLFSAHIFIRTGIVWLVHCCKMEEFIRDSYREGANARSIMEHLCVEMPELGAGRIAYLKSMVRHMQFAGEKWLVAQRRCEEVMEWLEACPQEYQVEEDEATRDLWMAVGDLLRCQAALDATGPLTNVLHNTYLLIFTGGTVDGNALFYEWYGVWSRCDPHAAATWFSLVSFLGGARNAVLQSVPVLQLDEEQRIFHSAISYFLVEGADPNTIC